MTPVVAWSRGASLLQLNPMAEIPPSKTTCGSFQEGVSLRPHPSRDSDYPERLIELEPRGSLGLMRTLYCILKYRENAFSAGMDQWAEGERR